MPLFGLSNTKSAYFGLKKIDDNMSLHLIICRISQMPQLQHNSLQTTLRSVQDHPDF